MLWPILIILNLVCCFGGLAYAGDLAIDAREALRTNGYDGIWSMDCSRTPTNNVPRINWVVPDHGRVQQWVDIGRGYYLEGIVNAASVTSDGHFTLSVKSLSGWSWVRTTIRVGNKIRIMDLTNTWRNRSVVDMKNGHDLRTNLETPPIEKCEEPGALMS